MKQESVEEFIARGGKIKKIKRIDDRFATHTTHFHHGQGYGDTCASISIDNAFRSKSTRAKRRSLSPFSPFLNKNGDGRGKHIRIKTGA